MKPGIFLSFLIASQLFAFGQSSRLTAEQYRQDFGFFWTTIHDEYCYFNKKQTDWDRAKEIYMPVADTITGREAFVTLLEKALYEIYDHHAILNTNTDSSRRLVPSGTDIWAEYIDGKPVITEVRRGFGAQASGVSAGMEVTAINDSPIQSALQAFLPKSLKAADNEAKSFALRLLLAGNHHQPRKLLLKYRGAIKEYFPDLGGLLLENIKHPAKIDTRVIDNIGYIKINDCLYDNELIPAFDSIMQTLTYPLLQ